MEAMLRSILDEILESKLTAIFSPSWTQSWRLRRNRWPSSIHLLKQWKWRWMAQRKKRRLLLKNAIAWEVILLKWRKRSAIYDSAIDDQARMSRNKRSPYDIWRIQMKLWRKLVRWLRSILMIQIFRSGIGFLLLTMENQGVHQLVIQP